MATATRKKASKKKASKKSTSRKKTTKKSASRKKTTKKSTSRKKASKKAATKKTAKKAPARRAPAAAKDDGLNVNGVSVITPNGRAPKKGALAYLSDKQIKVVRGFNPRSSGPGDLTELKRSIRTDGLLEPLVVRPAGDGRTFQLVTGERRLTALKELGGRFAAEIPCQIRLDLEGDDARAKAAAVAENSNDARTSLNSVELGTVAKELQDKHKWEIKQIARHCGYHEKTIRRALQILETPKGIQEKVRGGDLSTIAALELHKLPAETQKELESKVGPSTSAAEIRKLRKKAEADAKRDAAASGKATSKTTKKGKPSKAATVAAWQNARTKVKWLRELCHHLMSAEGDEIGTTEYHEIRGAAAWIFFDRGDIEAPYLPALDPAEDEDPSSAKKINAAFDALVKAEAERYEPEEGEEE